MEVKTVKKIGRQDLKNDNKSEIWCVKIRQNNDKYQENCEIVTRMDISNNDMSKEYMKMNIMRETKTAQRLYVAFDKNGSQFQLVGVTIELAGKLFHICDIFTSKNSLGITSKTCHDETTCFSDWFRAETNKHS